MTRPIVSVNNIGKRYQIGTPTLREGFMSILGKRNHPETAEFWSLRNVSFEVAPGEIVGIVGRNGAGKSTMLKILARVVEPTEGSADIYGHIGSLLEIGTGFHPDLTGRENVYLNGSMLGMKYSEVKSRFDEIVEFAGVEKFLNTPVKYYSTGMHSRLAFSVASHFRPDILLLDEVLAVGDADFQKKCLDKMKEINKQGRTIFFVSHDLLAIQEICSRALLFEKGRIVQDSDPITISQSYLELVSNDG